MPLGSIDVTVDPDLDRFYAEVSRATAALTADVKVTADTSAVTAEIAAVTSDVTADVMVDVNEASAAAAKASLEAQIGSVSASVKSDVDLASAEIAEAELDAAVGTITATVRADADLSSAVAASKELDGAAMAATGSVGGLGTALGSVGAASVVATVGIAGAGAALFELAGAASDVGEAQNVVSVIFGSSANDVKKFADEAAVSLGQSETAALSALGTFGALGKQAGFTGDELAGFSTTLTTLASDAASFKNTSPEEAVQAFTSALRGESEPIRRYDVLLSEAALSHTEIGRAAATAGRDLTEQEKVLARYQAILAQTTDLQGDFGRTVGESVPNQLRQAKASLTDFTADLGALVVPVLGDLLAGVRPILEELRGPLEQIVASFSGAFAEIAPSIGELGVALTGVFAELAPLLPGFAEVASEFISVIADTIKEFVDSGGLDAMVAGYKLLFAVIKPLIPILGELLGAVAKVTGFLARTAGKVFFEFADLVLGVFESLADAAVDLGSILPDALGGDALRFSAGLLGDKIAGTRSELNSFRDEMAKAGTDAAGFGVDLTNAGDDAESFASSLNVSAESTTVLADGMATVAGVASEAAAAAEAFAERYTNALGSVPSIAEAFATADDYSAENAVTGATDRINELNRRAFGLAALNVKGYTGLLSEALQVPPERQGDFIAQILTMSPQRQLELEAQTRQAQQDLARVAEEFARIEGEAIGAALNYGTAVGLIKTSDATADVARTVGAEVAAGFFAGMSQANPTSWGAKIGQDIIEGARVALKTRSPSLVFREIGEQVTTGLAQGISTSTADAVGAVTDLAVGMAAVPIKLKPIEVTTTATTATPIQAVNVAASSTQAAATGGTTIERQVIYTTDPIKAADESIRLARRAAWEGS